MTIFENKIKTVDGMPCIVLDKPIRGYWDPPMLTIGPSRPGPLRPADKKDFTQKQREKKQMFIKELLEEIKSHGW